MRLIGLPYFGFVNCIHERGSQKRADIDYGFLRACVQDADHVIALGRIPADALRRMGIKYHPFPHPSGLNRQINDFALVQSCLARLEDSFLW
jgi:hypothetical protein